VEFPGYGVTVIAGLGPCVSRKISGSRRGKSIKTDRPCPGRCPETALSRSNLAVYGRRWPAKGRGGSMSLLLFTLNYSPSISPAHRNRLSASSYHSPRLAALRPAAVRSSAAAPTPPRPPTRTHPRGISCKKQHLHTNIFTEAGPHPAALPAVRHCSLPAPLRGGTPRGGTPCGVIHCSQSTIHRRPLDGEASRLALTWILYPETLA
jgi:hypothetical protein